MLEETLLSTLDESEPNFNNLSEKGLERIAKMQNLFQNESNQITKMHDQSRDELERIAKIRRIKNHEKMPKEELIISLLKSKTSLAELFNNNPDNDKTSEIKKYSLNREIYLPKNKEKKI